jgi:hypothetical protein
MIAQVIAMISLKGKRKRDSTHAAYDENEIMKLDAEKQDQLQKNKSND